MTDYNDIISTMNKNNEDLILLNSFIIFKKRYRVFLHSGILVWEKENSKKDKQSIPVSDILAIQIQKKKNLTDAIKYFTIQFAQRSHKNINKWKHRALILHNSDSNIILQWAKSLQNIIDQSKRPRRLLMFINPFGGKKDSLNIYEKYGKPLFELAGIDVNVVISQRANQIRDILLTHSLDVYDGIVCVGGDGTFSEIFNGLLTRTINDLGISVTNNGTYNWPTPRIPIGVIPGGSTDTVAYCLHGTTDIKTTIIHIILGQTDGLDLASVSNNSTGLVKFYASCMSYGYLGDVAYDSEKFRWMGPKRYDYCGFRNFLANNGYEGEVSIAIDNNNSHGDNSKNNPDNGPKCLENCQKCYDAKVNKLRINQTVINSERGEDINKYDLNDNADNWKIIKGKFFMVIGVNISCACDRIPNGISPNCHLGDGCIDLVLIKHTTFFNNIRLLLKLSGKNSKISELPFVDIYRTRKFCFRTITNSNEASNDGYSGVGTSTNDLQSINSSTQPIQPIKQKLSVWNCDGEVIHESDAIIRSHCQLVNVFRRGLQENDQTSGCGFCKD